MKKLLPAAAALLLTCNAFAEGILDANSASVEEMATLPHMDETLAQAVVDNRPFISIGILDELLSADLGEDELEKGIVVCKDMASSEQTEIPLNELI